MLSKFRTLRNELQRKEDGNGGEVVDVFVKVGFRAQGMAEVGTAEFARPLPLHSRDIHPVIIDKRQRTV